MTDNKQTYQLETFTLICEIRQRENAPPLLVATLVLPDNFVLTERMPVHPVDRENNQNIIRFLEKALDLKPYFKSPVFEEKLKEFDNIRLQSRKQQYDALMDALLSKTGALKNQ